MKKKAKKKVLVIHGLNLHLLGKREPDVYGNCTLNQKNQELRKRAQKHNLAIEVCQSNSESTIVEKITKTKYDFLIINPAAYTHTSIAIRDALLLLDIPIIEVHLSNVHAREDFRKHSYFSDIAVGVISGLGPVGYELALQAALSYLGNEN